MKLYWERGIACNTYTMYLAAGSVGFNTVAGHRSITLGADAVSVRLGTGSFMELSHVRWADDWCCEQTSNIRRKTHDVPRRATN
jgi:hypothetical protein